MNGSGHGPGCGSSRGLVQFRPAWLPDSVGRGLSDKCRDASGNCLNIAGLSRTPPHCEHSAADPREESKSITVDQERAAGVQP